MLYKTNSKNFFISLSRIKNKPLGQNLEIILKGISRDEVSPDSLSEKKAKSKSKGKQFRPISKIRSNSFIITIDKKKGNLRVVTDNIAPAPLYYQINKDTIRLSNNLDKLPCTALNLKAVDKYFKMGLIPPPETIYENTYKLKPGTYEFDLNAGVSFKKEPVFGKKYTFKKVLNKMFLNIKNCSGGKKLAILATGGLDSSFLAAITKKMKPTLFFAALEGNESLEYNLTSIGKCKRLSQYLKLPFKVIKVDKRAFVKSAEKVIAILPEPIRDYDLAAVYSLFEQIAKRIPSACLLSGIGANELFNLPGQYLRTYLEKKIPVEIDLHRKLAENFGLSFCVPYLSEETVSFSLNTPLALRRGKIPFKRELVRSKILPWEYIEQPSRHSSIPKDFLRLLKNTCKLSGIPGFKKISPAVRKKIDKNKEIILALWIKRKFLNAKKTR